LPVLGLSGIKIFNMKKIIVILVLLLIGILIYAVFFIPNLKLNYAVYSNYIKWESIGFNPIKGNKSLLVSDSTFTLDDMVAYGKYGKLKNQNPDSIYIEMKKVFPSLELATIYDFYNKNRIKSLLDVRPLSGLIRTRNLLTYFDNSPDTLKVQFSRIGFNHGKTQAMVYVCRDEKGLTDYSIYFYKFRFGLWHKQTEINVSFKLWQYGPPSNLALPPPPF
jgi:hypothetical protein